MIYVVSCAFYQDSKCLLKGGCCDLNCSITRNEKPISVYDEIETFAQWKMERKDSLDLKEAL